MHVVTVYSDIDYIFTVKFGLVFVWFLGLLAFLIPILFPILWISFDTYRI
jgi:hypothetical protein